MIVGLISDLILRTRTLEVAKHLGVELVLTKKDEDFLANLRTGLASLIVIDLHAKVADVFALTSQAHELCPQAKIISFFSHVEHELGQRASELDFLIVMPRSKFFGQLESILSGPIE